MENELVVKVRYLRQIPRLKWMPGGDWIDLYIGRTVDLFPGDYEKIPLGVAIELPEGYEAIVAPRSSTFERYGILLANGIGIIDEKYCGNKDEWQFPAYATRRITIPAGTRICQFRILKHQPQFSIEAVEHLGNVDRGGFGSTGE